MKILDVLKKYCFLFFLVEMFSLPFVSHAQNDHLRFKRISNQDGLIQNWVRCIYQDDTGYMWFGTSVGLNRYDGYEFNTYSLGGVNINAIAKKNDHELWVCNDFGVYIYDNEKDSVYPFSQIRNQTVLCIKEDFEKNIWFGTNTGLIKFNQAENSSITYTSDNNNKSGLSNNYINTLCEDSDHNLWIGTKAGLNLYQKSTNTFKRFLSSDAKGSISGNDIMSICEDHNKRIWIGTAQDGVDLLTKDTEGNHQFHQIIDGYIVSLMVDHQNNLWIGRSSNGGLLKLNLNDFSANKKAVFNQYYTNRLDPESISDNSIFCTYQDHFNDIWIGTFGGGVNFYSYRNKKFAAVGKVEYQQPSVKNSLVNAILEEEKYIWIGTEGGLDRYDKKSNTTRHFEYERNNSASLGANPVYALFKDSHGNLWVGTWNGGLSLYNYKTESFKRFLPDQNPGSIKNGNVFTIYQDTKGNLWIGTIGGGLNRYDYKTEQFKNYQHDSKNPKSLYYNVVNDIKETKDGQLYISTYSSLERYNYISDDFSHFPLNFKDSTSITSGFISTIFEDSRKNLWIGTNKGLAILTKNLTLKYTTNQGLPGNIIQGILEDENENLWISSNKGLSKFMDGINLPEKPVFINFTDLDGISGNEFKRNSVFKNDSGIMYFGSSRGYTYFNTDSIYLNNTAPKLVFTEFQLLSSLPDKNKAYQNMISNINSVDQIDLFYENSDFRIKFAALNYLNTQSNKYKYKLNGYDKDWINADNSRVATYKNLQPGNYTFMVIGSNNDEVWSQTPKTLQITIHPPWYKTWIFKFFIVLVILLTLILFYQIRFSIIKNQKRKLELKVEERTKELMDMNLLLQENEEEITLQNNELYNHRNNLEKLIEERTSQLEIAKLKAEESDRLKTAFLHNISHEIRTPLNSIVGFSEFFLLPTLEDEKRINYANIVSKSSEQLLLIITDIINIATLEAGKEIVKESLVDINQLMQTLFEQFESSAQSKNISFKCEFIPDYISPEIYSDQIKVTEILSNLINNAIKFTKDGFVNFGCQLKDNFLEFYVSDSGIGVPADMQELIFKRFMQVETTVARKYGGTGLGLSISKSYIEMLGGRIWLNSELGKGTNFYFTVPYNNTSFKT